MIIVCGLGGFHTLMSYLGGIGKVMECSGIEEAFSTIYADKVIPHIMSGKTVSTLPIFFFLITLTLLVKYLLLTKMILGNL